ncbi:MAG: putative zinc-binding metallopeptidase [Candidatus Aminicenantes bacterium RBG_16_66_30]
MSAKTIRSLVQSWETVRFELLKTRISDLRLAVEGSPLEPYVARLRREMDAKRIRFKPEIYLTDIWGCPDRTPVIGVPFYLADARLARLEEEQAGAVEDPHTIMMLLRHEAGHAVNYAYRLWRRPSWEEIFGPFTKPYRDAFRPDRTSRHYVRHIAAYSYGRTYAQKHPDEDFAETFAVWMTPRSDWRARYRSWPVIRKLLYVDRLMKEIRGSAPESRRGRHLRPADRMTLTLAEHYGKKAERFRRDARGYVDDSLHEAFPASRGQVLRPAAALFKRYRDRLVERVVHWSVLTPGEAKALLRKLEARAAALGLSYRPGAEGERLMDVVSLVIALALDYAYTGRLTG